MNAYELADDIKQGNMQNLGNAANMLRQQADRIAELEKDLEGCEYFLEAQTNAEPVAWIPRGGLNVLHKFNCEVSKVQELSDDIPLYTAPQTNAEPVGRFYWESVVDGHVMAVPSEGTPHYNNDDFPLYTTPQTKPLSDEEIIDISENLKETNQPYNINFARAIEERHGIK